MAIVDVYDALTSDRPHRGKKTHTEAIEFIRNDSGISFDPGLVDVFIQCENELIKAVEESMDKPLYSVEYSDISPPLQNHGSIHNNTIPS
jgi:HD-GYP domain-containing protein (c-di-GMP phosphodiesterase class II)